MELVKINALFGVKYGINLELVHLAKCDKNDPKAIRFVSRTETNNGISAYVLKEYGIANPAHTISVAGGGSVLSSFYQDKEYYSGRDIYYLTPLQEMSRDELIYYTMCIRANKYKYNYGRQANKTLKDILVPKYSPEYVSQDILELPIGFSSPVNRENINLEIRDWKPFLYSSLFLIKRGRGGRINDLDKLGKYPFVTATDESNGWSGLINNTPMHPGNVITVTRNGSVGEAFYQPLPFCSTEDVHVFNPLFPLNKYLALFIISIIRKEKYRFNYGRKWGLDRMNKSKIILPVKNNKPDFKYMEMFMKSLSYSSAIEIG